MNNKLFQFGRYSPLVFTALLVLCSGCASWKVPSTLGEKSRNISYGYTPLDPLPVGVSVGATGEEILKALPDETMRLAIGQVESGANVVYGPAKAGYAGKDYVVVLDYIKYNTKSFGLRRIEEVVRGKTNMIFTLAPSQPDPIRADVTVPVYVGVGLRMTANIRVNEGSIDLGNLIAIGVAAQAKQVSGTLVIQTLGISGETISSAIPIPSEINTTTIQNALMAIGTIKSKIYDPTTSISPRVVAVYNNLGGAETINGFISSILEQPLKLDTTSGSKTPL